MRSPAPVRVRCLGLMDQLARLLGWSVAVVGGAALMWLGAALFGGATATAAPGTSVTFTSSPRHKLTPSTTSGAPRHPGAEPVDAPRLSLAAVSEPTGVWDQIAHCESGGRWNISTGNGYSGGLQFKASTWRAYGGTKYASSAHKATKSQQIEIAEKVRAGQGWGAWPACSRKAGLSGGKSKKSKGTVLAAPKHKKDSGTYTEAGKLKKSEQQRDKARLSEKARHGDKARSDKARSDKARSDKARHSDRTRPGDKARTSKKSTAAKNGKIVISRGDTLSALARKHKVDGGWQKLFEENKGALTDPNKILPGQELSLPRS